MHHPTSRPPWIVVLFPAVAMLLGWGLRGYIGGGPFGALIPGVYVALSLTLLLGYTREAAAMAALFGAVGVGYGGNMTYGQTLGFLRDSDTVYWGLLGCVVKGGVWGLLGGAVLGVGLTRHQYERKTLVMGFLITIVAFYVGVKLINDPKLIYFSNRLDKPRDESWAGLLFAALALLTFLLKRGSPKLDDIPRRFAAWGALGGALGFGGGALWMVFGPLIPIEQQWIGWWKAMEFSFGFIFGAALGWCAYLNQDRLRIAGKSRETPGESWGPLIAFGVVVIVVFAAFPVLAMALPEGYADRTTLDARIVREVLGLLLGFVVFGAAAILLGLRSLHVAWHVAITLTFFHTVFDFVRDLSDVEHFGYGIPWAIQILILIAATAIVAMLVHRLQRGPRPVHRLFLLAVWSCYLTACVRSFLRTDYIFPPDGETLWSVIAAHEPAIIFVHGTFTISAIITTLFIVALRSTQPSPRKVT
jgi:hypothetical protein